MSNVTAPVYRATEFLYQNVDFTSLNWFELKWAQWYLLFKVCSHTSSRALPTDCFASGPFNRDWRHVFPPS